MRLDLRTSLSEALGIAPGNLISIVGAGGKTSLMYGLGRELARCGCPVLLTTTTKIMYHSPGELADVVLGEETEATLAEIARRLQDKGLVLAGRSQVEGKIVGFSPRFVESLRTCEPKPTVIAECDGARGKSLKVPRADEPPVAQSTDVYVAVAGADCLGKPLTSDEVFEPEMVASVAKVGVDAVVDRQVVVAAMLAPQSYLGRKPPEARFCVFINKVDVQDLNQVGPDTDRSRTSLAFEVGLALKTCAEVDRVIYGSLEKNLWKGFLVLT